MEKWSVDDTDACRSLVPRSAGNEGPGQFVVRILALKRRF